MNDNVTRTIGAARPMIALVGMSLLALAGCARGTVQEALGMGKRSPDEFSVVQRAPLIIPPDFNLRPPEPGAPRPQTGTTADQAQRTLFGQSSTPATNSVAAGAELDQTGSTAAEPASTAAQATSTPALPASSTTQAAAKVALPTSSMAQAAANPTLPASSLVQPEPTAGERALLADAGGATIDPQIRQQIAQENQQLAQVEQALFTRVMEWRQPSTLGATVDAPAEAERLRANKAKGQPPTAGDTPSVVERRQSPLGELISKVF
jgi:hypothetical protein